MKKKVLTSQMHFLTNKNVKLPCLPLFWTVNYIRSREHVVLLSDPAVYLLFCARGILLNIGWHCCLPISKASLNLLMTPMHEVVSEALVVNLLHHLPCTSIKGCTFDSQ